MEYQRMDAIDDRFAVYTVVLFLCSEIAVMAGVAAGAVTFAALGAGIELSYWLGRVMQDGGQLRAANIKGE
jgi:hypothetical protein